MGGAVAAAIFKGLGVEPDPDYADTAVVHFRCSDVPFVRHPTYVLLPRSYFAFAAEKIRAFGGAKRVVLLSCATLHRSDVHPKVASLAKSKCPGYARVIAGWVGASETRCIRGVRDSVAALLGAHSVVSTGGSFSFVAGVSRGDGRFISPSLAGSIALRDVASLASEVPWVMYPHNDVISHRCAGDYSTFDYAAAPRRGCNVTMPVAGKKRSALKKKRCGVSNITLALLTAASAGGGLLSLEHPMLADVNQKAYVNDTAGWRAAASSSFSSSSSPRPIIARRNSTGVACCCTDTNGCVGMPVAPDRVPL